MRARENLPLRPVLADISALKGHEEIDEENARSVRAALKEEGVQRTAVIIDSETLTIIDGHHRVEAAKRLGLLRICAVPVEFVSDSRFFSVSVLTGKPFPKGEIIEKALSGKRFPPKTTRNFFNPGLGGPVHVSSLGEGIDCPLFRLEGKKEND